jgi:hypothetical protein
MIYWPRQTSYPDIVYNFFTIAGAIRDLSGPGTGYVKL